MYASFGPSLTDNRYCSRRVSLSQIRDQDIVLVIVDTHKLNMLERCEACNCPVQHLRIIASAGNELLLGHLPLELDFHLLETGSIEVAKLCLQFYEQSLRVFGSGVIVAVEIRDHVAELFDVRGNLPC